MLRRDLGHDVVQEDSVLVIGIGNEHRGDDGVGLAVVREVCALAADRVATTEIMGDCSRLVEAWDGWDRVLLVDAAHSGSEPGKVHRLDATSKPIPPGIFRRLSTHSLGVADGIELARSLERLPTSVVIYGIEGKSFDPGAGLSREVEDVLPDVVRRIMGELKGETRGHKTYLPGSGEGGS